MTIYWKWTIEAWIGLIQADLVRSTLLILGAVERNSGNRLYCGHLEKRRSQVLRILDWPHVQSTLRSGPARPFFAPTNGTSSRRQRRGIPQIRAGWEVSNHAQATSRNHDGLRWWNGRGDGTWLIRAKTCLYCPCMEQCGAQRLVSLGKAQPEKVSDVDWLVRANVREQSRRCRHCSWDATYLNQSWERVSTVLLFTKRGKYESWKRRFMTKSMIVRTNSIRRVHSSVVHGHVLTLIVHPTCTVCSQHHDSLVSRFCFLY